MPSWKVVQCSTPGRTSFIGNLNPLSEAAYAIEAPAPVPLAPGTLSPDVEQALALYAAGFFPMDDPEADTGPLPFYAAEERTLFELDERSRAALRRRLRRSLRDDAGWALRLDERFETVLTACARPRSPDDGVWITPRLAALYRRLHAACHAHSFELYDGERLGAGLVAVLLGRAAMLESMTHWVPHAGNMLLTRTLDHLAERGYHFADVQLPTPHTMRLGARMVARAEYERRLRAALRVR
jgi:leucyl/phenylalanyl-tRNA--protein transferase